MCTTATAKIVRLTNKKPILTMSPISPNGTSNQSSHQRCVFFPSTFGPQRTELLFCRFSNEKRKTIDSQSSTLFRRVKNYRDTQPNLKKAKRQPELALEQDIKIAEARNHFALQGVPLIYQELADLVMQVYGGNSQVKKTHQSGTSRKTIVAGFLQT